MIEEGQIHLRDYFHVVWQRRWTVVTFFVVLVTVVTIGTFRMKPVYRATTQLLIEKEIFSRSTYNETIEIDTTQRDYYQTQYKILKSRTLAKKTIDKLRLEKTVEFSDSRDIVGAFLETVIVEPVRNTRLINLKCELTNPNLAAHIVNTLAEIYIQENWKNRISASRAKLNLLSKSGRRKEVALPYEELEKISRGEINLRSLPSVIEDSLIKQLKAEHAILETEYANLSKRYKEKHPKIISLKASLETLKKKIDSETKMIVEAVKTELSGELKTNNIRIIDPAEVPDVPVKPKKRLNIALAMMLGLFGGIGLAFFFDYLDNTIKAQEDIEKYIELPFLGHIPTIKLDRTMGWEKATFVNRHPKSNVSESLRDIRTGIMFSTNPSTLKTIVVTSSVPEEGKTLCATNLAITLAQGKNKVLLVEADMRRPGIKQVFKLDSNLGLSNYLTEQVGLDSIIQETNIDGLSVVTCGHIPPNPSELLGLPELEEFIDETKKKFDRIIFDTPPLITVTDGLILAKKTDGVIIVVRHGKMNREIVNRTKQKLQEIGTRIIGIILNNVDIEKEGRYSYYYYYSQYGYDRHKDKKPKKEVSSLK